MSHLNLEMLKEKKIESQKRRAANRDNSPMILQQYGIPYESKNNGAHLVVGTKPKLFDFWPGTGKWKCRLTGKEGRGVFPLMERVRYGL